MPPEPQICPLKPHPSGVPRWAPHWRLGKMLKALAPGQGKRTDRRARVELLIPKFIVGGQPSRRVDAAASRIWEYKPMRIIFMPLALMLIGVSVAITSYPLRPAALLAATIARRRMHHD